MTSAQATPGKVGATATGGRHRSLKKGRIHDYQVQLTAKLARREMDGQANRCEQKKIPQKHRLLNKNRRTDGQTHPLIEMRRRIQKQTIDLQIEQFPVMAPRLGSKPVSED